MSRLTIGRQAELKRAALFITYDGLLDPLGGSQILPYLLGIAAHPRPLHILSFEKPDRFAEGAGRMRAELAAKGIGWTPLPFSRRGGKAGKLWDLARMYRAAWSLQRRLRFGIIHCRSYQAMQAGCLLKRLFGVRTLFDMRGLWVDERIDGGLWRMDRAFDRWAYRRYKRIERGLLECADHVIALTARVVPELHRIAPAMTAPVTVIPCCADFDHFGPLGAGERAAARARLGIADDAMVLSYLGSLGTWYMLEEMLRLFAEGCAQRDDLHLLLITRDWGDDAEKLVVRLGLAPLRGRIHVYPAARGEVPGLLGSSDLMLSFIKPAYSKIASSPTKLAEAFAMGIPAISNAGIGDVDALTVRLDAGAVVDLADPDWASVAVARFDAVAAGGGPALRQRSRAELGLEIAAAAYRAVYDELERPA